MTVVEHSTGNIFIGTQKNAFCKKENICARREIVL